MLQTRPSSASGILQNTPASQGHHQYQSGSSQMHMAGYHSYSHSGPTTYRGQTSLTPGAPYAFTGTPGLSINSLRPQHGPYLRTDQRTLSAPVIPTGHTTDGGRVINRSRYPAAASFSTSSSSSSDLSAGTHHSGTRDDSAITSTSWAATRAPRPQSTINTSIVGTSLAQNPSTPTKTLPDRYRRPVQRRAENAPSSSGQQANVPNPILQTSSSMPGLNQGYIQSAQNGNSYPSVGYPGSTQAPHIMPMPALNMAPFSLNTNQALRAAVDDMHLKRLPTREEASRYRRRSIHTIDMGNQSDAQLRGIVQQGHQQDFVSGGLQNNQHPLRSSPVVSCRPASSPGQSGSYDNTPSTRNGTAGSPVVSSFYES